MPDSADMIIQDSRLRRRLGVAAVCVAAAVGVLALPSTHALAVTSTTLFVNPAGAQTTGCTSSGSGACQTITEGITAAEALTGDVVTIDVAAATYDEQLVISSTIPTLTIHGAGASSTTIDGSGTGCDVTINDGEVTVSGMTITDGDSNDGGGVCNNDEVTLTDDTISHDQGFEGGGVNNGTDTSATITDVTFSHDSATGDGGAVYVGSQAGVNITDSPFSGDSADEGGGVFNGGGVALTDDTFTGDDALNEGGGLANYAYASATGTTFTNDAATDQVGDLGDGGGAYSAYRLTLTGDTMSDDTATESGGAVDNIGALTATGDTMSADSAPYGGGLATGDATLSNDTLAGDHATMQGGALVLNGLDTLIDDTLSSDTAPSGGGVYVAGNTISIASSILDKAGCSGAITDNGYNVESDNSCGLGRSSLVSNASIDLATTLAANGSAGPKTLAITASSSALKEVPAAACTIATDERGDPRPGVIGQTACDAGAYEFQATVPSAPRSPHAKAGKKSITVSWKAPSSNGGLSISGFRVYCSKTKPVSTAGAGSAKASGHATSTKVGKLKSGKKYYCVIVARNAKGKSAPSAVVSAKPKA
jgi:predicted outer membrane repeat protein